MYIHENWKPGENKCPSCNGKGSGYTPSDGYENSKSWRCQWCHGNKTFESFVNFFLFESFVESHERTKRQLEEYQRIYKREKLVLEEARKLK